MKKTLLTLSCFFTLFLAARAQVVINEIMYNPPEAGTDSLEYVELFNAGTTAVNLEGWFMDGVTLTFPATTLAPGSYLLTAKNAAAMQNLFGKTALQWTAGALDNNGEVLRLRRADSTIVDEVTYDDLAPWPVEPDGSGPSLVLCDPASDNSLPGSWKAAITPTNVTINGIMILANPGAASGCATTLNAKTDAAVVPQNQTSSLNVLANDDIPVPANITVSIEAAPAHGTAEVNPDNTIAYAPNNNYCGADGFYYKVCDNTGCDTAFVQIEVQCYPKYTIAQVTGENADGVADSSGVAAELTGKVYGVNTRASLTGFQFTLIDDSNNGINVFHPAGTINYTVQEGDKVTVRGIVGQFNGLIQILPDALVVESSNNPLVTPQLVVVHEENTESKLIKIGNLRLVDDAQWTTGLGNGGFTVLAVSDDFPNDTITIRIDNDVDLFNQPVPPQPFDLTGIGGQFDPTSPYTSGYQIAPRYIPDVSTLVSTRQADFSAFVRLSPNPAGDRLWLHTTVPFQRVTLFSAAGVPVRALESPALAQEIPVQALPAGVYFVRFEKDGAVWTTRVIKQ